MWRKIRVFQKVKHATLSFKKLICYLPISSAAASSSSSSSILDNREKEYIISFWNTKDSSIQLEKNKGISLTLRCFRGRFMRKEDIHIQPRLI